jgi:hypothetical protein
MRILFLSIVLSIAVPSLGIADDAPNCVPGYVTKTCGDYIGCAKPEWECSAMVGNGGTSPAPAVSSERTSHPVAFIAGTR